MYGKRGRDAVEGVGGGGGARRWCKRRATAVASDWWYLAIVAHEIVWSFQLVLLLTAAHALELRVLSAHTTVVGAEHDTQYLP